MVEQTHGLGGNWGAPEAADSQCSCSTLGMRPVNVIVEMIVESGSLPTAAAVVLAVTQSKDEGEGSPKRRLQCQ